MCWAICCVRPIPDEKENDAITCVENSCFFAHEYLGLHLMNLLATGAKRLYASRRWLYMFTVWETELCEAQIRLFCVCTISLFSLSSTNKCWTVYLRLYSAVCFVWCIVFLLWMGTLLWKLLVSKCKQTLNTRQDRDNFLFYFFVPERIFMVTFFSWYFHGKFFSW